MKTKAPESVAATIICYHCGHVNGEIRATAGLPLLAGTYVPVSGQPASIKLKGRRPRCSRCGGPTFCDEIRTIPVRQPRLEIWTGPGRPPRDAVRVTLPEVPGSRRRRPRIRYVTVVDGDPALVAELLSRYHG